mgnify:FL=1
MSESEFCYGFVLGFVVAGLLGYSLQRIRFKGKVAAQASKKEMVVLAKQSPAEVYKASLRARQELAAWFIAAILLAIAAVVLLISLN